MSLESSKEIKKLEAEANEMINKAIIERGCFFIEIIEKEPTIN